MGIFSKLFKKDKAAKAKTTTAAPAKEPAKTVTVATAPAKAAPANAAPAKKPAAKKAPAKKAAAKKPAAKKLQPQCAALTAGGDQCKNSARGGSKYCGSHKGYQPPSAGSVQKKKDTANRKGGLDTIPGKGSTGKSKTGGQAQCAALTADGKQCRNQSRDSSKYCGSHKGYRHASTASKVKKADTKPRVAKAKDTKPSTRRSHYEHNGYKLYQKGNRYFFSKKSQADAKKDGAAAVYALPKDRSVTVTPNGLPVLKKK